MPLINRRPCIVEDVAISLGIHVNEAIKALERLSVAAKAPAIVAGGKPFYAATMERK